ncbi:tetratricopeptide repeat protein [Acidicapsa dinghuensis]|uniref:Tetratricopeptide repeat protein n=1 Tax=Acidicapsa dinghuensis TaxID=2218256 RepID=A0ABW1EEJ6_9BACT|nr:serine/threonine-protein kinase [Acidicapsa dinghuensis]
MDTATWEKIQTLFHQALDLPELERDAFLRHACTDDATMLAELHAMLAADAEGTFLDNDLARVAAGVIEEPSATQHISRTFGPYTTVHLLGEGGMAVVYLAQRKDLGGHVAIKVLRDAWLSPSRRERFLSEQRTLAQLNYPSIAHLYDADTLSDGTPWFAMEYVQGISLTAWCAKHNCSITRRLQLFRTVCDAVQYAHQQAVIHRDLKPSNIYVKDDGSIRLLDFGIAKHLETLETPASQTVTSLRMLTPAYASPEQIRGEAVSVQADVYSLGIILFELLTSSLPYDLSNLTPGESATLLLDHDTPKPSALVARNRMADKPALVASRREWADLDVLCLAALHKDQQRRYRTVDALIRDIDHYLSSEPLDVRRDSLWYRASTFVRRNRRAVAFATGVLVFIAALITWSTLRIARARDAALAEAARTARVQSFLVNLFDGGNEDTGPPGDLRVVQLVDRGAVEANALSTAPRTQAELFETLGTVEDHLGKYDKADQLLHSSLALRTKLNGPDSPEAAEALLDISKLRMDQARFDEAEQLARQALAIDNKQLPPSHPARAKAISVLGMVLEDQGKYSEAIPILQQAVALQSAPGGVETDLSASLTELANCQFYSGHLDIANSLNQRVLAIDRRLYGDRNPQLADDLINLGAVQYEWGHFTEAEKYDRQALDIERSFYGNDHPETASAMTLLARALNAESRPADAVTLLKSALSIEEKAYGLVHPRVASTLNDLGHAAQRTGNFDEARADFQRMADIYRTVYNGKHYYIGVALGNLASAEAAQKQYASAERHYREALAMYADTLPANHKYIGTTHGKLGRLLLQQDRYKEAAQESVLAYQNLKAQPTPPTDALQEIRIDLQQEYTALHQPQELAAILH